MRRCGNLLVADKSNALAEAWCRYCTTNRLIAYGDPDITTEEEVEAFCKKRYEEEVEEINKRYESTDNKS